MAKYQYIGNYATTTETGAPVAPGEVVELDNPESDYYKGLIDSGTLVEVEAQPKAGDKRTTSSSKDKEG